MSIAVTLLSYKSNVRKIQSSLTNFLQITTTSYITHKAEHSRIKQILGSCNVPKHKSLSDRSISILNSSTPNSLFLFFYKANCFVCESLSWLSTCGGSGAKIQCQFIAILCQMGNPSQSWSTVMQTEVIPLGKSIFIPSCLVTSRFNVIFQFSFISFNRLQCGCLYIDVETLHSTKALSGNHLFMLQPAMYE